MPEIDAQKIADGLVKKRLAKDGAVAVCVLELVAERAGIAKSLGLWPTMRAEFEHIADLAEERTRRIRGLSGATEPNEGVRPMKEHDLNRDSGCAAARGTAEAQGAGTRSTQTDRVTRRSRAGLRHLEDGPLRLRGPRGRG
jgi:hypothetical protein